MNKYPANFRIGQGYDSHRLLPGAMLRLGGIDIPSPLASQGHSDGDALLHALGDALLGALALGDIGTHFPDTNPALQGADSRALLAHIVTMVQEQGYSVGNVDATVHLQTPKLAPHTASIRDSVAQLLRIPAERVSIKAKTGERMGFVGECQGIEVDAIALLIREEGKDE